MNQEEKEKVDETEFEWIHTLFYPKIDQAKNKSVNWKRYLCDCHVVLTYEGHCHLTSEIKETPEFLALWHEDAAELLENNIFPGILDKNNTDKNSRMCDGCPYSK